MVLKALAGDPSYLKIKDLTDEVLVETFTSKSNGGKKQ